MGKLGIITILVCLVGVAILGYAAYIAMHPSTICRADGIGCGTPKIIPDR